MSCCGKSPYQDSFRNTRPITTPRKATARCVDGFRKHKFSDRLMQIIAADNCLRCGAPNRGR